MINTYNDKVNELISAGYTDQDVELLIYNDALKDLTLLRDKFQQAGKDIENCMDISDLVSSNGRWVAKKIINDVLKLLGFAEAKSVTGSKGCNTSEALNPSLSAVRGLKPAKDRRKLGKPKEKT
jgi:hypothetical protein